SIRACSVRRLSRSASTRCPTTVPVLGAEVTGGNSNGFLTVLEAAAVPVLVEIGPDGVIARISSGERFCAVFASAGALSDGAGSPVSGGRSVSSRKEQLARRSATLIARGRVRLNTMAVQHSLFLCTRRETAENSASNPGGYRHRKSRADTIHCAPWRQEPIAPQLFA